MALRKSSNFAPPNDKRSGVIITTMKKFKIFALVMSLMMAVPFFLSADEPEVEIQLIEVGGAGMLPGDNPLDGPGQSGGDPTDPSQIRATIAGRTLTVYADNANNTQVIVRNASGNVVVNSQFYGFTTEQLANTGAHTIEIHNGGMTLVGSFSAH